MMTRTNEKARLATIERKINRCKKEKEICSGNVKSYSERLVFLAKNMDNSYVESEIMDTARRVHYWNERLRMINEELEELSFERYMPTKSLSKYDSPSRVVGVVLTDCYSELDYDDILRNGIRGISL